MIEPGLFDMIMRLRSAGISDNNVLHAMETVKRSHFVKIEHVANSYDDQALPIACGQTLPPPMTIAIMLQSLGAKSDDKILLIGVGSGYSSAVLAQYTKRVYGIDRYKTLIEKAEEAIKPFANNVVLRHGDGHYGWQGQAPFARIVIMANVKAIPKPLIGQLEDGGKLLYVKAGQLIIATKENNALSEQVILPMDLPALEKGKSKSL